MYFMSGNMFLKLSRLIPKRTLAKEFTQSGMVDVNGSPAKSSYSVKTGDEIKINRRNSYTTVRVKAKKDASTLYELLAQKTKDPLMD